MAPSSKRVGTGLARLAALSALAAASTWAAAGAPARADPPGDRTGTAVDLGATWNPAGLRLRGSWFARRTLPDGEGLLLRGRELGLTAIAATTPSYGTLGLEVSAIPVAILELRARYQLTAFYGTYGALWHLPSRDAAYGDAELSHARGGAGLGQALTGAAALRVKVGPIIVRNELSATYLRISRPPGWYYYPEETMVVAPEDAILYDQLLAAGVLWQGPGDARLLAGPMVDVTRGVGAELTRLRAGAVLAFTLPGRLGWLRRPSVGAMGGVQLRERNRQGQGFAALLLGGEL